MDNSPDQYQRTILPAQANSPLDLENFKRLYNHFDSLNADELMAVYSEDVFFKDPIHELTGQSALIDYFTAFRRPGVKCRFEFINQVVNDGQAFFHWEMHYTHPSLHQGAALTLEGSSLIKFTSQVFYHQDFYDMGAMIYQHLPLLGWAVKKINARIVDNA